MGLLNARPGPNKPLPLFRVLRCPLEGHQVSMCRGLCQPLAGQGICGRLAPHAMKGRTQLAMADRNRRLLLGAE